MGDIYLRKYGVATTVDFSLYKADGTALKTDAASASGDVTLYRDEAAVETLDDDQFTDEGAIYSVALSATEMQAARIIVCVVDQTSPQVWLDKTFIVETYGNASAMHEFDLDTGTQAVNVTQIGGVAQSATDLKDFADAGYDPATHKVQGVVLVDTTTTNTDMVDVSDLATILADTNELQTDWANGGRLDLLIDGIKAVTDLLTLASIADAVHDEVVDSNAPANANSLRETINVIASATAGKLSGAGSGTLVFRDLGDTKDRVTATMDANNNRTAVVQDGT